MKIITTKDPKIIPQFKDLIQLPVVVKVNRFNEEAAAKFSTHMQNAHNTGQPIIPVVIDSYGGEVYSLLSMMTEIENAQLPVATIGMGKCMSCGAVLLSCGEEGLRFMAEDTTVMIHDVASIAAGKVANMKVRVQESERLGILILQKMAKNCGHKSKDYFINLIEKKKHLDWYLTSRECKKHKLINHIKMPEYRVDVSAEFEFRF